MVLRRVAARRPQRVHEGWMRSHGQVRGWVPWPRRHGRRAIPQPALRRAARGADRRRPSIDRALTRFALEQPDDAAARSRLAALRRAARRVRRRRQDRLLRHRADHEQRTAGACRRPKAETFGERLRPRLGRLSRPSRRARCAATRCSFALAGETIRAGWFEVDRDPPGAGSRPHGRAAATQLRARSIEPQTRERRACSRFILLLRQLASEFDAFGDSAEAAAPCRRRLAGDQPAAAAAAGRRRTRRRHVAPTSFLRQAGDGPARARQPPRRGPRCAEPGRRSMRGAAAPRRTLCTALRARSSPRSTATPAATTSPARATCCAPSCG